jgi:hypothetical protein
MLLLKIAAVMIIIEFVGGIIGVLLEWFDF